MASLLAVACMPGAPTVPPPERSIIAADEPRAAEIARVVMEQGGNAADAVVAAGLAMAVTLPSRVGLGGGGRCLVHDGEDGSVRVLDFSAADGAPSFLRGLFALHAEHGSQRWETLAGPAESLARLGHPVSRALAADAAGAPPGFGTLTEGALLTQPDLAQTLTSVRTAQGVGAFYTGGAAERYAAAAGAAGLPLSATAIRSATPRWQPAQSLEYGRDLLHLAADDQALASSWRQGSAGVSGPAAATASALSSDETAVGCIFTLGRRWGSGVVAEGTGIVLPAAGGRPLEHLAVLANQPKREVLFVGAGDIAGPLRRTVVDSQPLASSWSPGGGDARGTAIACNWDRGLIKTCIGAADPRGHGLAFVQEDPDRPLNTMTLPTLNPFAPSGPIRPR